MIKVLHLGMTDNLGGIETYLMNYFRHMDNNKIKIDFTNIYKNDFFFKNEIENLGGKIYKVPSYYRHPIKYLKETIKIIKENDYDIVHCNMNSAVMLFPLIAAKMARSKIIIAHAHNASCNGLFKTILHNLNKHFIPFLANYYFACSNLAGKWFFNEKIIDSDRYKIINNAVDLKKFKYDKKTKDMKRQELNIDNTTLVIGHIGRFCEQKNHKYLLQLFNEIHKKIQDSKLLLIGEGPLYEETQELADKLNLKKSIIFLGKRNDANELYQAMDIFLLPSLYEGLPVVGIEAQASGILCQFSSTITKEVKVVKSADFIDINCKPDIVANKILENYKNFQAKNVTDEMSEAGFNIETEAKKLEKLYCILKKQQ